MASSPIISCQIEGEKSRSSDRFYFLGLQNHCRADCNHSDTCSLEGKLWQKQDSILKSRDITLPTKVCTVKATVFPVVMYGCESWTIKKAEHWRTDAFKLCKLWHWRRLLRVPQTARRSIQPILKEINPEYSLEVLMLKLHYFGHLMQRADSLEKTDAGKVWRQKEKGMVEDEMVR